MSKTREKYSHTDERRMWKFLYSQLRGANEYAETPLGYEIWKAYVRTYGNDKSVSSLATHMRRVMKKNFEHADLHKKEFFYLFKKLKWPLTKYQKIAIQQRFKVKIELDAHNLIKTFKDLDVENRRNHDGDSDTENDEDIEIDEKSTISDHSNSDVNIMEDNNQLEDGNSQQGDQCGPPEDQNRDNSEENSPRNNETQNHLPENSRLRRSSSRDSLNVKRNRVPIRFPTRTASTRPSSRADTEALTRMGIEMTLVETSTSGVTSQEKDLANKAGPSSLKVNKFVPYIPTKRTLRYEKRRSAEEDRVAQWLGKSMQIRRSFESNMPTHRIQLEEDLDPSVAVPSERMTTPLQPASSPQRAQVEDLPATVEKATNTADKEKEVAVNRIVAEEEQQSVKEKNTNILEGTSVDNLLNIQPLATSTPIQTKKSPAKKKEAVQIKKSMSQMETNELLELELQSKSCASKQTNVVKTPRNLLKLNISVDRVTQTSTEGTADKASGQVFNDRFLQPPQPPTDDDPIDQIALVYYRNLLRENLRKLLWNNLPALYDEIPARVQEHLKTTKEFGWILKHARDNDPRNQ